MSYALIVRLIRYGIFCATIIILCCCLYSCSASKRLKRLVRNNPELLKIDTVYSTVEVPIPVFSNDTVIAPDTISAQEFTKIIGSYSNVIDSLTRSQLVEQIHHYVQDRDLLSDTFYIPLKNKGYVKIYQDGKVLRHVIFQPPYVIKKTVPVRVDNVYRDIPWRLAWYWVLIISLVCACIAWYLTRKK